MQHKNHIDSERQFSRAWDSGSKRRHCLCQCPQSRKICCFLWLVYILFQIICKWHKQIWWWDGLILWDYSLFYGKFDRQGVEDPVDGSNELIQPGRNFTYEIELDDEIGTLWWHARSAWARATVHGAFVVLPAADEEYPFPTPTSDQIIIFGNMVFNSSVYGCNFLFIIFIQSFWIDNCMENYSFRRMV